MSATVSPSQSVRHNPSVTICQARSARSLKHVLHTPASTFSDARSFSALQASRVSEAGQHTRVRNRTAKCELFSWRCCWDQSFFCEGARWCWRGKRGSSSCRWSIEHREGRSVASNRQNRLCRRRSRSSTRIRSSRCTRRS
jgi:hypothetical protein